MNQRSSFCVLCQAQHGSNGKRGRVSESDRAKIVAATSLVTGVAEADLKSMNRQRHFSRARQLGMVAALNLGFSLPQAAMAFGRSDHTTAIWARDAISKRILEIPEWGDILSDIVEHYHEQPEGTT
jgi:chromosomal replication initiation ATPase DnaA